MVCFFLKGGDALLPAHHHKPITASPSSSLTERLGTRLEAGRLDEFDLFRGLWG